MFRQASPVGVCGCGCNLLFFFNLGLFTCDSYLTTDFTILCMWMTLDTVCLALPFLQRPRCWTYQQLPPRGHSLSVSNASSCWKKKILNLFSLPSFSMCVNGGMAVPGCVVVCTCMGVLWGVGKEICEKLSHQRLFSHLTPVSQHVPGRWSSSIPLGLTVSRGPFCHCLHQYS